MSDVVATRATASDRVPPRTGPASSTRRVDVAAGQATGRRRSAPRLSRQTGPLLLLAVWAAATYSGLVGERMFPTPDTVAVALYDLTITGELPSHLWASLQRVLAGLTLGIVGGVGTALLAGLTRRGDALIDSTMQIFKAIPNFALIPLLIVWMGIGEEPKIALIAMGTGMHIYINTYGAIHDVDNDLVEAARTLELSRYGLVRHVILPGSVPGFLVGLRLATASAWLSLIFAETVNAQQGIGFLMTVAQNNFRLGVIVGILVVYAVIGLLSYAGVRYLERRLLAWRRGFVAT